MLPVDIRGKIITSLYNVRALAIQKIWGDLQVDHRYPPDQMGKQTMKCVLLFPIFSQQGTSYYTVLLFAVFLFISPCYSSRGLLVTVSTMEVHFQQSCPVCIRRIFGRTSSQNCSNAPEKPIFAGIKPSLVCDGGCGSNLKLGINVEVSEASMGWGKYGIVCVGSVFVAKTNTCDA